MLEAIGLTLLASLWLVVLINLNRPLRIQGPVSVRVEFVQPGTSVAEALDPLLEPGLYTPTDNDELDRMNERERIEFEYRLERGFPDADI